MQRFAAQLRHRELTQELYDIGDEVSSYLENLAEAIADYDADLVADCLAEFDIIAGEGRADSREVLGELIGLRQALTSGVRSGTISALTPPFNPHEPTPVTAESLAADYALPDQPVSVRELTRVLDARTQAVTGYLTALVEYTLASTDCAAKSPAGVRYPHTLARLVDRVHDVTQAWISQVERAHPAYARAQRGQRPPAFLAERARIDAVVAKVAARRRRLDGRGGATG